MMRWKKADSNKDNLKIIVKSKFLKNATKLKFKYPPISELVNGNQKILKVKKIYKIREIEADFFFITVHDQLKNPKIRFFLANLLANQSSDLLVLLAKSHTGFNKDFKLVQYPLYPYFHRIGLLCLTELTSSDQISTSLQSLKKFKDAFRKKIENIKNI